MSGGHQLAREYRADLLQRRAELLEFPLTWLRDGYEVGLAFEHEFANGRVIHVHEMAFNWRISESFGLSYGRSWCYEGRSDGTFIAAVLAAIRWGGDPDSEPRGWIKSWDGRRNDGR